jgi:hypothetical protein
VQAPRIVGQLVAARAAHHEEVLRGVHTLDAGVFAGCQCVCGTAPRVPHDLAGRILGGPATPDRDSLRLATHYLAAADSGDIQMN